MDLAFEPWPRRLAPGPPRVEQVCTDESWTRAFYLEFYQSHTHTYSVRSYLRGNPPRAEGRAHTCSVESARGRTHMHLGHYYHLMCALEILEGVCVLYL